LNIGSIEWGNKCAPNCHQNVAGNLVRLGLFLENLLAISLDSIPTLEQAAQRLSASAPATTMPACFSKSAKKRPSLGISA
jgi:hypothetical protein